MACWTTNDGATPVHSFDTVINKDQTVVLEDRVDPAQFDFDTERRHLTEIAKRAKAKAEARREVQA